MTRSRASAKKAGASFETDIATYLATHVDDRIERRTKNGSRDRGDLSAWRFAGRRIVAELKNYGGQIKAGTWIAEAETERLNDDAAVGLVICKRRGTTDPGDQFVLLTLRDLIALTTGERP